MKKAILAIAGLLALALTVGAGAQETPGSPEGFWLAGDLHIHTTYSHDSWNPMGDEETPPKEYYTLGHSVQSQFTVAATRGLDYLAITDHNDIRSINDPGFGALGVIGVTGYENSLQGHAQMLGAKKIYDKADGSATAINAMADLLRADGGVFQINHPAGESTKWPLDPDWMYGYAVIPDVVEAWNINPAWQPPAPSGNSTDDAIRYWEGWLDRGAKVGATGGSDNHYAATTPIQGAGQPTTWVFASAKTESAILAGLRAGRTFISHQPPNHKGPRVFLEGDSDSNGSFESMVGDAVAPGSPLRVRIENAPSGSHLRIVSNGGSTVSLTPLVGVEPQVAFTAPTGASWVRAELLIPDLPQERKASCDGHVGSRTTVCRNRFLLLSLTSSIYISS